MVTVTGTWADLLGHLVAGDDLGAEDTAWAMDRVMSGEATAAQVAAFAVALRAKGESAEEVRGMADAMLAHARPLEAPTSTMDIVGTGGDRSGTVNISTMASIVTSATGATIAKHGNRSASSRCGTADVLEALGVAIDLPPQDVHACLTELGIGFCYAPLFHPAFRHSAAPRREIGIPTAFNLLGPLTNPARPSRGLIGCADRRMAPVLAEVLASRDNAALVVRGDDGMDEITTLTSTTVWVVRSGAVREQRIHPPDLGVELAGPDALKGGDAEVNAAVVRELLAGKRGPVRDAVLLNAAGALAAHEGPREDLAEQLRDGIERAAATIDSGAADRLLTRWSERSTEFRNSRD